MTAQAFERATYGAGSFTCPHRQRMTGPNGTAVTTSTPRVIMEKSPLLDARTLPVEPPNSFPKVLEPESLAFSAFARVCSVP